MFNIVRLIHTVFHPKVTDMPSVFLLLFSISSLLVKNG